MPATTPGGLPYPLPTEMVRDGAQNIQNLAEAIDSRGGGLFIQAGNSSGSTEPTGIMRVGFPTPFKAGTIPVVVAWARFFGDPNWNNWINFEWQSYGWDHSQFHIVAVKSDGNVYAGNPITVQWIAIGQAP